MTAPGSSSQTPWGGDSTRGDGATRPKSGTGSPHCLVSLEEINRSPKQDWKLNSTALKHIRAANEVDYSPVVERVDLFDTDPYDILTLSRTKGVDYSLGPPLQPWSWRGMLKSLREDTKRQIVGDGVIDVWCAPLPGSYCMKRQTALREIGTQIPPGATIPIWDFFVLRGDGVLHRFHPSYTNTKVGIQNVDVNDSYSKAPP